MPRSEYCVHGTYIGTWWGPDYMCGHCESGWTCGHNSLKPWCRSCRYVAGQENLNLRGWYRNLTPIPQVRRVRVTVLAVRKLAVMVAGQVNGRRFAIAVIGLSDVGKPKLVRVRY